MFSRSPVQSTLSLRSRAALPTTEAHEIQNESRLSPQYCYVINYAPETGQPCYRLQIRNVQGYNEQVVASTRFTMRTNAPTEAEKLVRTARSTGNDTQSSN
jgi:hypothetical protein